MTYSRRLLSALLLVAATVLLALAAPTPVHASQNLAELDAAATSATARSAQAAYEVAQYDSRLALAKGRLAAVERDLPQTLSEEARTLATAIAADLTAGLSRRADAITADRRLRLEIRAEIAEFQAGRDAATERLAQMQAEADAALAQLSEAQAARSVAIAAVGKFPVDGPNHYINSWGFPRSGGRSHRGTDIMGDRGTPIVAVKDGWVRAGYNRLGGHTVWLTADDGVRFYYAHLDSVAVGEGRVVAGQNLGTLGDSGNAKGTPPHLHFEIHSPNEINPYEYLLMMVP